MYQYESYFQTLSFWEHLCAEEKTYFLEQIQEMNVEGGEAILAGDSNCLGVLFILSGHMRIYLLSEDGKQTTIYRLKEGEVCILSASCALSAIRFQVQIDAETHCRLLMLPSHAFSYLMQKNIYLEAFAYRTTTAHFSDVIQAVERMFFLTLEQRIAAFVLDEISDSKNPVLNITQEQLANAIGSAREAVSRSLKQMQQEGLLTVSRGKISILDPDRLKETLSS